MNKKVSKLYFTVFFILFLVSLASSIWLYYQKQELTNEFEKARIDWARKIKDLVQDLSLTQQSLEKYKGDYATIESQLRQVHSDLTSYRTRYKILEEENFLQNKKLATLSKELKNKEEVISKLRQEIEYQGIRFENIDISTLPKPVLSDEYYIVDDLSNKLADWSKEKDVLKEKLILLNNKLKRTDVRKEDIIRQIDEVNKLLEKRIIKIAEFRNSLEALMKQSKKLAIEKAFSSVSSVELPSIIVHKEDKEKSQEENLSGELVFADKDSGYLNLPFGQESEDAFSGRVLLVNQADNFVVINLGAENNITEGILFEVYRGENKIGRVQVVELRDKLSAANIEHVVYGEIITANDSIRLIE